MKNNSENDYNITYTMKNDIIFRELFTRKGNEELLIEFLSSLTGENITKIDIRKDVTLDKSFVNEKYGVLDIYATINDEKVIDIEMQLVENANFDKRLNYYSSKMISQQLGAGEDYILIKPAYVISIVDYDYFDYMDEYIQKTVTVLENHKEHVFSEYTTYIIVELPKFRKKKPNLNIVLEQWLTFIDYIDQKGVKEAMLRNEKIKKAEEELEYLTGDEELRRRAELKMKYIRDMNGAKQFGVEKGLEQGIQQGIEQKNYEIISNMLLNGFDLETIMKITGASKEYIESIKSSIK